MSKVEAIKDTHTNSAGRKYAREMICMNKAQVFFIEWATPVYKENLNVAFEGLAPDDAEPNLAVLASLALNCGMDVISCDLSVQATIDRLNSLDDRYRPYGTTSVFQPWGKGIRDRYAAATISDYFKAHPRSKVGILLFGSDHFVAEDGRNAPPLDELVKELGIECNIVNSEA